MARITTPAIYVQECDEVIVFEDTEHACLDIVIDTLTVHVFADRGMPVIKVTKENPNE